MSVPPAETNVIRIKECRGKGLEEGTTCGVGDVVNVFADVNVGDKCDGPGVGSGLP